MILVIVTLLWAAGTYRLIGIRRFRTFVNVATSCGILTIALGFTIKAEEPAIDALAGSYSSDLLEHGAAAVSALFASLVLLGLRTGRPTRRQVATQIGVASAVLAIMITTFFLAPIHAGDVGDLDERFGQNSAVVTYRLAFHCYAIVVFVGCLHLSRKYASEKGDLGRTIFLAVTAAGYALTLFYCLTRVTYILVDFLFGSRVTQLIAIGSAAVAGGLALIAIGTLVPRLARAAPSGIALVRGLHQLRPLWRDLTLQFPSIILPTERGITVSRIEHRDVRHLVEIEEGLACAHLPTYSDSVGSELSLNDLALLLDQNRANWSGSGTLAVTLLPPCSNVEDERSQIRALADEYRRVRRRSSSGPGFAPVVQGGRV